MQSELYIAMYYNEKRPTELGSSVTLCINRRGAPAGIIPAKDTQIRVWWTELHKRLLTESLTHAAETYDSFAAWLEGKIKRQLSPKLKCNSNSQNRCITYTALTVRRAKVLRVDQTWEFDSKVYKILRFPMSTIVQIH